MSADDYLTDDERLEALTRNNLKVIRKGNTQAQPPQGVTRPTAPLKRVDTIIMIVIIALALFVSGCVIGCQHERRQCGKNWREYDNQRRALDVYQCHK